LASHADNGGDAVNAQLLQVDRELIDPDGLPGRPWYRNLIYAPGLYTGYAVKTLPAVRESIEEKRWNDVDKEIARTGAAIEREVALLRSAAKAFGGNQ
jgi:N-acetylated-alpha-linked acidic dipeptidase